MSARGNTTEEINKIEARILAPQLERVKSSNVQPNRLQLGRKVRRWTAPTKTRTNRADWWQRYFDSETLRNEREADLHKRWHEMSER